MTKSLSIPQDLVDFLSGFGNKAIGGFGIYIYICTVPYIPPFKATYIYIYTWYISNTDNRKVMTKAFLPIVLPAEKIH